MGILSRATIIAALFTGASALHAFEQRTIWFNVPYNVTYPQTTAPSFPPTFGGTQNGDWTTFADIGSAGIMGIPTGGNAGLLVPSLGQLFADLSIPASLQGTILSASLTVDRYMFGEWTLTLSGGLEDPQNASVDANGDMIIWALQSPATTFGDVSPRSGPELSNVNLSIAAAGSVSNAAPVQVITATDTSSDVIALGGTDLSILGNATPSFATLPIDWNTNGGNETTGNYSIDGQTFAGVRIGITYTFLPESDWAWAGLPLVFGAWVVRRRMSQSKAA